VRSLSSLLLCPLFSLRYGSYERQMLELAYNMVESNLPLPKNNLELAELMLGIRNEVQSKPEPVPMPSDGERVGKK